MKNQKILCIDLGSSYTKIALRSGWDDPAMLIRDPNAPPETSFCIPSVVARVERGGGTEWAIGLAAAEQKRGDGVHVYQYWKARLFSDAPEAQESRDLIGVPSTSQSADEYHKVGVEFFRGLREKLQKMEMPVDGPTRVCIPKLDNKNAEARVVEIMAEAGWRPTKSQPTVYEPESNVCGVLTRGRNATWRPPPISFMPSVGRSLYLEDMLEPDGLFAQFRRVGGSYGVLVVDVGAFTTDFGFVQFDTSFRSDEWKRPKIIQQSRELGVRELDKAIYDNMRPEVQQVVNELTPSRWDSLKAKLYAGNPVAVRNPKGGILEIGRGDEARMIQTVIEAFARRVVRAKDEFCRTQVSGAIHAEALTGGGTMIPAVRQVLGRAAGQSHRLYDLLDESEVRRSLIAASERDIEVRLRQNQELVRGGSAIGGCSVLFA